MMCRLDGSVRPIDFHVLDGEKCLSEGPLIEVEVEAPHRIRYASQEWLDIFQLSKEEISGRTLMIISGPATNLQQLKQVIATAVQGKEARGNVFCYSRAGMGKNMVVKGTPNSTGDGSTCFLTMLVSDAVPLKDAVFGEDAARAIVSANHPHIVEHVNSRFTSEFGYTLEIMTGKTLRMIHGPHTDTAAFQQLLREAKEGFSRSGLQHIYTKQCQESQCEVRLIPLIGHCGDISHLMAVFTPPRQNPPPVPSSYPAPEQALPVAQFQPSSNVRVSDAYTGAAGRPGWSFAHTGSGGEQSLSRRSSGGASLSAHTTSPSLHPAAHSHPHSHDFSFSSSASAAAVPSATVPLDAYASARPHESGAGSSRAGSSNSEADRLWGAGDGAASLKLVPRKKRIASADGSGALELTVGKLQEMGRISMKQAAKRLGIAPSTLKKACRKLGVERWPHGAHSEHASKSSKAMDYDASYVRRLFNKYGDKKNPEDGGFAGEGALGGGGFGGLGRGGDGEDELSGAAAAQYSLGAGRQMVGGGYGHGEGRHGHGEGGGERGRLYGGMEGETVWQHELDITVGAPMHPHPPHHHHSNAHPPSLAAAESMAAGSGEQRQAVEDSQSKVQTSLQGLTLATGREGEGEAEMMDDVCALFDAAVHGLHQHAHPQRSHPPPELKWSRPPYPSAP